MGLSSGSAALARSGAKSAARRAGECRSPRLGVKPVNRSMNVGAAPHSGTRGPHLYANRPTGKGVVGTDEPPCDAGAQPARVLRRAALAAPLTHLRNKVFRGSRRGPDDPGAAGVSAARPRGPSTGRAGQAGVSSRRGVFAPSPQVRRPSGAQMRSKGRPRARYAAGGRSASLLCIPDARALMA